ncbi:MAG TPA: Gfo/Idh/MocA family oxidoreductase [Chthonomonadaceae bacterium]|nr:Gfo/Idh/MocA family oxidoreductase [Chthonomonadaceae bacterium]
MRPETGFGVIGVGTWGGLHARVYASTPGAHLAAICDANGERARQVGEACGAARIYTDYRQLLDDPNVQAVSIALPDFLHREATVAAAQAGKHILVEKPLATTEADCLAMLEAAQAAGVLLFVDFHNRWSPLFHALKQALEAGELGNPQLITYRLSDTLYVPTQMLSWARHSSVAWFLASHCLDTLLWLMNARAYARGEAGDTIERLSCLTRSRLLGPEYGVDTPDFYLTTLEWKSGLVAHVENSWILPESGPSVVDMKCQFLGSRGAFYLDGARHGAIQKHTDRASYPDAFVTPTLYGRPMGFGAESIRHFAQCVMTGQRPLVDGADGLAVTRLILKMEESAQKRQPVEVGPLFDPES